MSEGVDLSIDFLRTIAPSIRPIREESWARVGSAEHFVNAIEYATFRREGLRADTASREEDHMKEEVTSRRPIK